ncbi:MAG: hypothetical protein JW944_12230 [Deltaproteobacteria bacterium]|nr:hypothetical protein [Deltaproteobacteria bacterium]
MKNKPQKNPIKPVLLVLSLLLLPIPACEHMQPGPQGVKSAAYNIKRIAIMGFEPAVYQGDKTHEISSETALLEKSYYMTSMLLEASGKYEGYELVGPDSVREAKAGIDISEPGLGNDEIAGRIALELQADAALTGYLYRWKDREGSDYAVKSPASVFFDLRLVSPDNGSILWEGRFSKTQRSLSDNLLDIKTFFKGKGKWMTAEGLAELGLNELTDDLFTFMKKEKGAEN